MDFAKFSILCVGDVMLDAFHHGDIERISPEAPVPIMRLRHAKQMPGGAGNVACNIAALGGSAVLTGLVGLDGPGEQLRGLVALHGNVTDALLSSTHRPTTTKTRFISGRQQVVRVDEESGEPLHIDEEIALIQCIEAHITTVQGVVISDYGKGALNDRVLASTINGARSAQIPIFVDPKSADFSRYRGADCVTPNLKEFTAAAGSNVVDEEDIKSAAALLLKRSGLGAILVTRSDKGMTLVERSGEVHSAPARAREVFDVSGAGDTVIASLALAYVSGRSLPQAMHIANAAAGVVVSKLGTATANIAEVVHELATQADEISSAPLSEIQSWDRARALIAVWREQGLKVGFANGCFDILHSGHIRLLATARLNCDRLVVALNTDESTARLKGRNRPVNNLENRARVMAAVRFVDCVVCFTQDTPLEVITYLMPDILVKGSDYKPENVVGADVVRAAGGRVVLANLVVNQSTSNTIAQLSIMTSNISQPRSVTNT